MLHYVKYFIIALILFSLNLQAQNGFVANYTNAKFGQVVRENQEGGYSIGGFKGVERNNVLFLKIDAIGNEVNRFTIGDFSRPYTFQENNVELLLTSDEGIVISAYENEAADSNFLSLIKYNSSGQFNWSKFYSTEEPFIISSIVELDSGIVFGAHDRTINEQSFLGRTDQNGDLIWKVDLADSIIVEDIEIDTNNHILVLGSKTVNFNGSKEKVYFVSIWDEDGLLIEANVIAVDYETFSLQIEDFYIDNENNLLLVGGIRRYIDPVDYVQIILININQSGELIKTDAFSPGGNTYTKGFSVTKAIDNGWIVCGVSGNEESELEAFYGKISSSGWLDWINSDELYDYGNRLNAVISTSDEGYLFVGQNDASFGHVKAIKINKNGFIQTNTIAGFVFNDANDNCTLDNEELKLKNVIVKMTDLNTGEETTNWSFNYGFEYRVDTGRYEVSVVIIDEIWSYTCEPQIVHITEEYSNIALEIPLVPAFDCPLLTVDLTTPIIERCEETNYRVQVYNIGTVRAEDAYLELELDASIELIESSRPFAQIGEGLYKFQLGNLNIGEGRIINLLVEIDCDSTILGQTHCATAHVYPDSLCLDLDAAWDGSIIDVDGECLGDSIGFEISNDGANRMIAPLKYYVVEDDAIFRTGNFQLDPGESVIVFLPANGLTYRVETDENPGYLFGGRPSSTIEGCGASLENSSLGFVNRFPLYDNSPFVSIDCQESIIDIDGNLHKAYPEGYGDEHFIRRGDELEYFIRFENTTGEVIQNVAVIDTLDQNLDLSSLFIGVTSHPYDLEIIDESILKIIFNDINLSNEENSSNYGFVKFKINPKSDLELGTVIENEVVIKMDSIILETELVYHTLGMELVLSIEKNYRELLSIQNYPNPFIEQSKLTLIGEPLGQWTLSIFNIDGSLFRTDNNSGNVAVIERGKLTNGLYLFTIKDKKGLIGTGKIIVQD